MSASGEEINLAGDVPNEAIEVFQNKPDVRQAYNTVDGSNYSGQSGDVAEGIRDASGSDAILDLGSGEYTIDSAVSLSSGVGGLVGDGSDSCTIHYSGSHVSYLFNLNGIDDFVMQGVTFQAADDVSLANAEISNQGWFEDVVFRGQRDHYAGGGGRFTFLIEAVNSSATNLIHRCEFPDGGTNHPEENNVGHAIGPNADPDHVGLNVWKECYAQDFRDNGYYVAHSPGRNVLWNCTAINNSAGNIRLGHNDVVVGGYSEVSSQPDDRAGKPLEADTGDNIQVVGLHAYGAGDAIGGGAQVVQLRSDFEGMTIDRSIIHGDDVNYLARLDEGDVDITGGWWFLENTGSTAVQVGGRGNPANVTADGNWKIASTDSAEISGPITIAGTSYSGTTSADAAGLGDPQPFPSFHFDGVESGQGADYPSGGGGGGGGNERTFDGPVTKTTDEDGVAGFSVPDGNYNLEAEHDDTDEVLQEQVSVEGGAEVTMTFSDAIGTAPSGGDDGSDDGSGDDGSGDDSDGDDSGDDNQLSDSVNQDGPVSVDYTEEESTIEQSIVDEVNSIRDDEGLQTLSSDYDLAAVARWHSEHQGQELGEISHEEDVYGNHGDRIEAAGLDYPTSAENLYWVSGYDDPVDIGVEMAQGWMDSPGHRENIVDGDFDTEGTGVYIDEDGGVYATQLYAVEATE